jgi:hypothetical protein
MISKTPAIPYGVHHSKFLLDIVTLIELANFSLEILVFKKSPCK